MAKEYDGCVLACTLIKMQSKKNEVKMSYDDL